MNYKILAASSVIAIGAMVIVLSQTNVTHEPEPVVERVSTMDIAEPANSYGFAEATSSVRSKPSPPPPPLIAAPPTPAMSVSEIPDLESADAPITGQPKIAYRFGYGFRMPGDAVKPLQDRHADMCETRGPNVCRIISMQQSDGANGHQGGSLHLAVASPVARSFGKDLTRAAEGAEAELISSSIDGEDLSKQIVDTEARLRTRIVLRDRLMDVLRNRRGSVAELVEAERGVAKVNEEIDQARSWLTEMNGRVDFSQMHISYASDSGAVRVEGTNPITSALSSSGDTLASMLGGLIRLLTVLLPLILLGWLLVLGWRALGRPGSGLLKGPEYSAVGDS